jgi:hypothetical protein
MPLGNSIQRLLNPLLSLCERRLMLRSSVTSPLAWYPVAMTHISCPNTVEADSVRHRKQERTERTGRLVCPIQDFDEGVDGNVLSGGRTAQHAGRIPGHGPAIALKKYLEGLSVPSQVSIYELPIVVSHELPHPAASTRSGWGMWKQHRDFSSLLKREEVRTHAVARSRTRSCGPRRRT